MLSVIFWFSFWKTESKAFNAKMKGKGAKAAKEKQDLNYELKKELIWWILYILIDFTVLKVFQGFPLRTFAPFTLKSFDVALRFDVKRVNGELVLNANGIRLSPFAFMADGEILELITPQQFFSNPRSDRAKEFLDKIISHWGLALRAPDYGRFAGKGLELRARPKIATFCRCFANMINTVKYWRRQKMS